MEKIFIENRTDRPLYELLSYVATVMKGGRISPTSKGAAYCLVSTWADGIVIATDLNVASDRFVISFDADMKRLVDERKEAEGDEKDEKYFFQIVAFKMSDGTRASGRLPVFYDKESGVRISEISVSDPKRLESGKVWGEAEDKGGQDD